MNAYKSTSSNSLSLEEMIAYVQSRLSKDESAKVEAILAANPLYKEAVDSLRKEIDDPLALNEIREQDAKLDQKIDDIAKEIPPNLEADYIPEQFSFANWLKKKLSRIRKSLIPISFYKNPIFRISVVATITISLVWFSWEEFRPSTYQELAQDHFTHFTDRAINLGENIEEQALDFYRQMEYAKAIPLFQELLGGGVILEKEFSYRMFLGVSLLHEEKTMEAQEQFEFVLNEGNNNFLSPARWYLALTLLKRSQSAQAQEYLQQLINNPGSDQESKTYALQAKELIRKMENAIP